MKKEYIPAAVATAFAAILLIAASAPPIYTPWSAFRGQGAATVTTNPALRLVIINVDTSNLPVVTIQTLIVQSNSYFISTSNIFNNLTVVSQFTALTTNVVL